MPKPVNLGFDQAAAVGDSAFTALAAVRDQGKVQPGHRVLINGASGGVGTCAGPAREIAGGTSDRGMRLEHRRAVRSLGADEVIDYTADDFVKTRQRYEVMLDLVGNRSLWDCRRC